MLLITRPQREQVIAPESIKSWLGNSMFRLLLFCSLYHPHRLRATPAQIPDAAGSPELMSGQIPPTPSHVWLTLYNRYKVVLRTSWIMAEIVGHGIPRIIVSVAASSSPEIMPMAAKGP